MNVIVEETIKPAIEFLRKITQKDNVAIVFGHDNDSICSAVLIHRLLKKLHRIESKLIVSGLNSSVTEDVLETIKRIKPEFVIILDLSEIGVDIMTGLRNTSDVMIIDHHVPKGYVKVTYVNPRVFDKEIYLPASYLCYKIYDRLLDSKEILWVAGIGTLSDMGLKNCGDLFENIKRVDKGLVGKNENIDEILFDTSLLGKLSKIFDSARVVNGIDGVNVVLSILNKTEDYQDVLEGKSEAKKLMGWYELSEKEFNRLVKDFEKNKRRVKRFVLYEVKSKYAMKSPLATYLAKKMTNEVLVIYQKSGKMIDVSFRRGKMCIVDLNQLAITSIKNMPESNGGGHVQAAGCRFPTKYLDRFLRNLKGLIKPRSYDIPPD